MKFFLMLSYAIQNVLGGTCRQNKKSLIEHSFTANRFVSPKVVNFCSHLEANQKLASVHISNRPLRVVQIQEPGQTGPKFGRLIISGKMSDVCAELDRLVANEAACT